MVELGADAAGAPHLDRSQLEQPDAAMQRREAVRNVVDPRIEFEVAADGAGLGAGTLVDQLLHLGDRREPADHLFGKPQRSPQARRRIGVDGQDGEAAFGVGVGQQAGERGLAHAPFAGNCDLHSGVLPRPRRTASARRRLDHGYHVEPLLAARRQPG